jgi:hypothetical protein
MAKRPSPAFAVSILALAIAVVSMIITFTRTATTARIKEGSIEATDLSAGARAALRGAEGPQGKRGPRGPGGIPGVPGLPGASRTNTDVTDLQNQIDALQTSLDQLCSSELVANLRRVTLPLSGTSLNWDTVSC